jgi:hypothetical protein
MGRKKKRRKAGLLSFLASVGGYFEPGLLRDIGIGALFLGFIALIIAIFQGSFAFRSSAQPEPIALGDLVSRAGEGNPNVAVRDFVVCETFVHWSKMNAPSTWTGVYVPAVPAEEAIIGPTGKVKAPDKIRCMFVSHQIENERDLQEKLNQPTVRALVNPQKGPSSYTLRLLQQSYPGSDFDGCIILDVDDAPWAWGWICLLGGVAVIALFFGAAALLARIESGRAEKRR